MIGLSGVRVIVVDNHPEDALPIIQALSKERISASYFDGNSQFIPDSNNLLRGVRLAVLDMQLDDGVLNDKQKASGLVDRLRRIMSPDNGPYGVLAWTDHFELVNLFEEYLWKTDDLPKPVFIVTINKPECRVDDGTFNLDIVYKKILSEIKKSDPLFFLQLWEESSFYSAIEVTNILSNVVQPNKENITLWRHEWEQEMKKVIVAMAKAEAGKTLDETSFLSSFYGVLNPLHTDCLEKRIGRNQAILPDNETINTILSDTRDCSIEVKANINAMLDFSSRNLHGFYSGNVYKESEEQIVESLLADIIQKQNQSQLEQIKNAAVAIWVEISASCDHLQKKLRTAKFSLGLVIPSSNQGMINSKVNFIREFGPYDLQPPIVSSRGVYYIYFSAKDMKTSPIENVSSQTPVLRLRTQALADLQSWFSHYAFRPGKVTL